MKLLQHSWSDMLVLDHIHQRMHNNLPDETTLHNGQKFDLLSLGLLGVPSLADHFNDITVKLQELKFDVSDYICLKFLLLLNPGRYHQCKYLVSFSKLLIASSTSSFKINHRHYFLFEYARCRSQSVDVCLIFSWCERHHKQKAYTRWIRPSAARPPGVHDSMLPPDTGQFQLNISIACTVCLKFELLDVSWARFWSKTSWHT